MSKTELFVRKTAGGVYKVVNESVTTGNIFWVDSGAATAANAGDNGKNPDKPFATIDYAIGKCSDNNGDIIYVMPGHAETISGALSLAIDVAGIKILGLGTGYSMPKLTFSAAASTIDITAANTHLENLWLYASFATGVTTGITAGALADGLVIKNVVMEESLNTTEFLLGISIEAACHHVLIDGLKYCGVAGGDASNAIKFLGASDFSIVQNCEINGTFTGAAIDALTANSVYMTFFNNYIVNSEASAGLIISAKDGTTGIMANNYSKTGTDGVGCVGPTMAYFRNYTVYAANVQGYLVPSADS